jgi:hypothetical protein
MSIYIIVPLHLCQFVELPVLLLSLIFVLFILCVCRSVAFPTSVFF